MILGVPSVNFNNKHTSNPLTFGMSMVAGLGVVLMIIALAIGVVTGDASSTNLIGLTFFAGLVMLITGVVAWAAITRPFAHFDDINVPKDTGHGHGHEAHHDDHNAIVPTDEQGHPIEQAH